MTKKISASEPATAEPAAATIALPKKDEFLAYYYRKMVGRCSGESTGLKNTTHKRVRDTYQQCYSKYIEKRRLAPPKSFWEEHQTEPRRAAKKALTFGCD